MSTIADIQNMQDGVQLESPLTGTIKMVFPGQTGEYWFGQSIIVSDQHGEIKVMLNQRDPIPDTARGQAITVGSFRGNKGLMGCKVASYNGTKQLKMTKTGNLKIGGGSAPAPARPAPQTVSVTVQDVAHTYFAPAKPTDRDKTLDFWAAAHCFSGNAEEVFNNAVRLLELKEKYMAGGIEKVLEDSKSKVKEALKATEVSGEDNPFEG